MKYTNKTLLASIIALTLTACGGESDSADDALEQVSPPVVDQAPVVTEPKVEQPAVEPPAVDLPIVPEQKPPAIEPPAEPEYVEMAPGKVIDGYISGANVFLDINYNGLHDEGEPSTVTDADGTYKLKLAKGLGSCKHLAPLVTHVPVGAIDLDSPDSPVMEEYYMTLPPRFARVGVEDKTSITPLTTAIWQAVEEELEVGSGRAMTFDSVEIDEPLAACQALKEQTDKHSDIKSRLNKAAFDFAREFDMLTTDIYGDYIAENDTVRHEQAKQLVEVFKQNFKTTKKLRDDYPDANWANAKYALSKDGEELIRTDRMVWRDQKSIHTVYEVSLDFHTIKHIKRQVLEDVVITDNLRHESVSRLTLSNNNNVLCSVEKRAQQAGGEVNYGFERKALKAIPEASNASECAALFGDDITWTETKVTARNFNGANQIRIIYKDEANFAVDFDQGLLSLDPFAMTFEQLNTFNSISLAFDDTTLYQAHNVVRFDMETANLPEEVSRIGHVRHVTADKNSSLSDRHTKTIYYKNGLMDKYVGTYGGELIKQD